MSGPLRIQYPDAWYHVMNRGRRGELIFTTDEDQETFIDILKELVDVYTVNVAAYCLMSNHYHLLIQTPNANFSRVKEEIQKDKNFKKRIDVLTAKLSKSQRQT